jgi:hypothetical protein
MSKNKDKIAVLTIGRWQPPHVGHDPLISGTIQLARKLGGTPLQWISPSQNEMFSVAERTGTDPLSVYQRIYYLNKMYPISKYPNLRFLTDVRGGIGIRYEEQLNTGSYSGLTKRGKTVPINWGGMTTCNKYKYMSILKEKNKATGNMFSLSERCIYLSNRNAGVIAGEIPLPSKQCLIGLKKKNYTHVTLLVGSDRVAAFRKNNKKLGIRLFGPDNYETKQGEGTGERGIAGQRSIQLELDGDKEEEELKRAMDKFYGIQETKEALAQKYSGTRTRNFANTKDVVNFIESVKKGEMTIMDCYCLMNDIRNKGQMVGVRDLQPVTEKEFMGQLSDEYKYNFVEIKESVDKWALDNAKPIEDKKFRPLEPNVMRRINPNMTSTDTIATTRSTTTRPTGKLKFDGGSRKRKTRKHRKRKTRKHKKRKTRKTRKHRKKNYKKRRARKTRKNKN